VSLKRRNDDVSAKRFYAVVRIADDTVLYAGHNLAQAASLLDPGTAYAKAFDSQQAIDNAKISARRFREKHAKATQ
jgi:hypothetical protein